MSRRGWRWVRGVGWVALLGAWAVGKVVLGKSVGIWLPGKSMDGMVKVEWFVGSWASKFCVSYGSAYDQSQLRSFQPGHDGDRLTTRSYSSCSPLHHTV